MQCPHVNIISKIWERVDVDLMYVKIFPFIPLICTFAYTHSVSCVIRTEYFFIRIIKRCINF